MATQPEPRGSRLDSLPNYLARPEFGGQREGVPMVFSPVVPVITLPSAVVPGGASIREKKLIQWGWAV